MPRSRHERIVPTVLKPSSHAAPVLMDAERLHIARELHDIISYSFATINVHAGVAAHVADAHPEQAVEALGVIKAISREALAELRALLGVMRTTQRTDAPLLGLARLDALAATTTGAGLPTRVVISGLPRSLPPAVDRAAYRIAQEALTNALRHAGPQAAAVVTVSYAPERLVVEIRDDGRGPASNPDTENRGGGHGIDGMRERAAALGGRLEAGSGPAGGFRVRAFLPVGIQP